ncbi:imidazole glycerol phosphate synthase [Paucilactobacillus hokkaidonensis JCM 18461]|uniref:Imidazole glycerol phosphate synthase subunit HisH n=2 Tax=Paucilactobacillus hokkaidonensis TaxID=1193095 RepID=A0A0A1GWZ3_9LACO|nr:imidazole glycerol phosphate synthase subunit HisH [Paucilactobacillus hokkaidonensis]KRO09409.1 imidazole glycerol phosphate synthase subunit HisH [Paucilactobacillus hokkaidonensis]BAP86657.1 imidazole glycerol phosphate synthase [Paucilactobacillus hokkaidonensis JCM 18461]
MLAVVDYDTGNIRNLMKALDYVGFKSMLTANPADILAADGVILPGVGAFAKAMEELERRQLVETLRQVADKQTPLLGICLGMQLLFESSNEFGKHAGLGILPGTVEEIPVTAGIKVPEMGWNQNMLQSKQNVFQSVANQYTYFVHSYYANCSRDIVVAGLEYGTFIPSIVKQKKIVGMQFHPEKSGAVGLELLTEFKRMVQDYVATRN